MRSEAAPRISGIIAELAGALGDWGGDASGATIPPADPSAHVDSVTGCAAAALADDTAFDTLAMRVHAAQRAANPILRRFWDASRGAPPTAWHEIPPVPAAAFRDMAVVSGTPEVIFRTSGTTRGGGGRGEHHVLSLDLYRAAARANYRRHLIHGAARLRLLSLVPGPRAVPDSSLSTMAGFIAAEPEVAGTAWAFHPEEGVDFDAVRNAAETDHPVLLLTTAFTLAHLLDALGSERVPLPEGSRMMETGGFKGRAAEVDRATLYDRAADTLGIRVSSIINEYGMTELLSQAYDGVAGAAPPLPARVHRFPPWVRTRALDPRHARPAAPRRARPPRPLRPSQRGVGLPHPHGGLRPYDRGGRRAPCRPGGRRSPARMLPRGGVLPARHPPGPMSTPHRPPTDAWLFPPGTPAPTTFEHLDAGAIKIRYPKSDHHLAHTLASALHVARPHLAALATSDLITLLGSVGERFTGTLDDATIAEIAANSGLSRAMTRETLAGMARSWTTDALDRLVRAEFPDPRVLDGFVAGTDRAVRAAAPGVTLHFGAGSVPGVTVTSMLRALLVKSPVLVKPGAGDVILTTRFARELHRADPRLAAAAAVHYWPGGAPAWRGWERDVLVRADQVVVYGGNDTIESIRARAPASTRLIEHPHRIGVAIVDPRGAPGAPAEAARAVSLFDQKGCVSTHLIILLGDRAGARRWCERLAGRLARTGTALPPGPLSPGELSALHQLRGRLAMQHAASEGVEIRSPGKANWTVVMAPAEHFEPAGGRTAWVVPVSDTSGCLEVLAPLSPVLQTVGLAGIEEDRAGLAEDLATLGATRIVPLGEIAFPQPEWLHDGSRPLGELVRWSEHRPPGGRDFG